MNEDTAERIAGGAPARVRETFLRSAIPGLGPALEQVRARPARIRRHTAATAKRVVSLIDDPDLLARIAEHEERVGVRAALRRNPAWGHGTGSDPCTLCNAHHLLPYDDLEELEELLTSRVARHTRIGTYNVCDDLVIRTIAALPDGQRDRFWRLAFDGVLAASARAHVELAAGRLGPLDDRVFTWTARNDTRMPRLLDAETTHTDALLRLGFTTRHIPAHWDVTDDQWYEALATRDRSVLASGRHVPVTAIGRAWPRLSSRARVSSLAHARDTAELAELLSRLDDGDLADARGDDLNARDTIELLHRFPGLDPDLRLVIVAMLPRRVHAEYLLGRLCVLPNLAELPDVLAAYSRTAATPTHRALIENAGRKETSGENRALRERLIELLVERALPRELFAGDNRVSAAAHAYTWPRLTTDGAVAAFAGLLDEWSGTLTELVDTAAELAR